VFPIVVEVAPELADPCRGQSVPSTDIKRPFAEHKVFRQTSVTLTACRQPRREVEEESDLIGRRLRVVMAGLHQRPATQRAEIGQALDGEVVPLLRRRRQHVLGALLTAQSSAGPDGACRVGGQR
jgi:hypothetical protein